MTERDEEPKFQVRDRRRFTETGETREVEEDTGTASETGETAEEPPRREEPPKTSGQRASGPVEITLSTFLMSLSTQALMLLGEIPNPISGETEKDLDGVAELISVISMLQEKTRGNLDEGETKLIEQILYDLRMRYVARVQGQ